MSTPLTGALPGEELRKFAAWRKRGRDQVLGEKRESGLDFDQSGEKRNGRIRVRDQVLGEKSNRVFNFCFGFLGAGRADF